VLFRSDPENKDFLFRNGEAYYDLHTPRWDDALTIWTAIGARSDLTPFEKDVVRLHKARVLCELGRDKEALALLHDDVAPFLKATRARLMKRLADASTAPREGDAPNIQEQPQSQPAPDAAK
jgi:hypothetical protein